MSAQAFPGEPAFPILAEQALDGWAHCGMTLRDWFATHASEEDIADHIEGPTSEQVVEALNGHKFIAQLPLIRTRTQARYLHADAMLAARK